MELKIIYLVIFSAFIFGVAIGINISKFFSKRFLQKINDIGDAQLKKIEIYAYKSTDQLERKMEEKVDFMQQINGIIENMQHLTNKIASNLRDIDSKCDKREKLESEIIKLKKIIERIKRNNN